MIVPRKTFAAAGVFVLSALPIVAQTAAVPADKQSRLERIESCMLPPVEVKGEPVLCSTLAKRMAELHVPGVSIAIVHHGIIETAKGYGVAQLGGEPVSIDTLFQAGSISKPVAAMAALHQVQMGKLSLDADVNKALKTWKIPESSAAPGAVVTLRELLTHTAGFTVHGFPGYAATDPVPTLVQVLNGQKPANTPPIRLESVPGSTWNYSGGGYTVMQQALLDVTGLPFPELLRSTVLSPIGMTHSTYQQPLPAALRPSAATPYESDGAAVAGGAHTYPEMAAAGLWTTPSDLARYIVENQRSLQGKANHVLTQGLTEAMLTPGKGNWGLGVEIGGSASNPYFTHGGVNEGFQSEFVGYEKNGEGAAIMTNSANGLQLVGELMRSIAVAYDWPDFQPSIRTAVKVDRALLARYVGTYELGPNFSIVYSLEGDQLMTQATGQPKFPVYAESDTKFFLKIVDAEVEFVSDGTGRVTGAIFHQNGREFRGTRK